MSDISFFNFIKSAADRFKSINKKETIRLISHFDADGICSASLMINALKNEGFKYSLSIIKQLSEETLHDLKKEDYNYFIFTDLGSGQIELIKKHMTKTVFILDHHAFDISILKDLPENIIMVNPHMFGFDGSNEISGAGTTYLFTEAMDEKNKDKAYLALIGAMGDIQEKEGFFGLNKKILETAVSQGQIKVEKGLKWFGLETRALVYLITYNTEVYIPGITGSESNAIQFLTSIDIEPKAKNTWKRFNDLTEDEKRRLLSGIVMKRSGEKKPEDILGNRYILLQEPESSPLRDIKEFSTLLNACGRMDKPSLGIGACLNDSRIKKKAIAMIAEYKKEIVKALRWYEAQKESGHVIKGKDFIIINAHDKIMPSIIGTLASIVSNSGEIKKGTLILSMARDSKEITKVSLRVAGDDYGNDLREVIGKIVEQVGGQSGGHKNAAGAIIPTKEEDKFIEIAKKVFTAL
jgi:single-stranded-DNA-specific exonuclease